MPNKIIKYKNPNTNHIEDITVSENDWELFANSRYFLSLDQINAKAREKKIRRAPRGRNTFFLETLARESTTAFGLLTPLCLGLTTIAFPVGLFAFAGAAVLSGGYGLIAAFGERITATAKDKAKQNELDDIFGKPALYDFIYGELFKGFLNDLALMSPEELTAVVKKLGGNHAPDPLKKLILESLQPEASFHLARPAGDLPDTDAQRAARVAIFQEKLKDAYLEEEYTAFLNKPNPVPVYNLGIKYSFTALGFLALATGIAGLGVGLAIPTFGLSLLGSAVLSLVALGASAVVAVWLTKRKRDSEVQATNQSNAEKYLTNQANFKASLVSCQEQLKISLQTHRVSQTQANVIEQLGSRLEQAHEENNALRQQLQQLKKDQRLEVGQSHQAISQALEQQQAEKQALQTTLAQREQEILRLRQTDQSDDERVVTKSDKKRQTLKLKAQKGVKSKEVSSTISHNTNTFFQVEAPSPTKQPQEPDKAKYGVGEGDDAPLNRIVH